MEQVTDRHGGQRPVVASEEFGKHLLHQQLGQLLDEQLWYILVGTDFLVCLQWKHDDSLYIGPPLEGVLWGVGSPGDCLCAGDFLFIAWLKSAVACERRQSPTPCAADMMHTSFHSCSAEAGFSFMIREWISLSEMTDGTPFSELRAFFLPAALVACLGFLRAGRACCCCGVSSSGVGCSGVTSGVSTLTCATSSEIGRAHV